MPKKGIISCTHLDCDESIEGILPDNEELGYNYQWFPNRGGEIDEETARTIYDHHKDTGEANQLTGNRINGHRNFKVELEDGSEGEMEAYSYFIVYKEFGKERG